MRVSRMRVLVAAAVLLCCGGLQAMELKEGGKELLTDFSYVDADGVGKTTDLSVAWGWLLTPNHEVGPVVSYAKFDPDGTSTTSTDGGSLGGFYNYNFSTEAKSIVPFVGASLFKIIGDADDSFNYGAEMTGGLRILPSQTASVNVRAFYEKDYGKNGIEDADSTGIAAGLSIFW